MMKKSAAVAALLAAVLAMGISSTASAAPQGDGSGQSPRVNSNVKAKAKANQPDRRTAVFDGENLFVRVGCPVPYRPRCVGTVQATTHWKRDVRPISNKVKLVQGYGRSKVVKLRIAEEHRAEIEKGIQTPNAFTVTIREVVKAKKHVGGKEHRRFTRYKVKAKR